MERKTSPIKVYRFRDERSLRELTDGEKRELTKIVHFYEALKERNEIQPSGVWTRIARAYNINDRSVCGLKKSTKQYLKVYDQRLREGTRKPNDLSAEEKIYLQTSIQLLENAPDEYRRCAFTRLATQLNLSPHRVIQLREKHVRRNNERTGIANRERYRNDPKQREKQKEYYKKYYRRKLNPS